MLILLLCTILSAQIPGGIEGDLWMLDDAMPHVGVPVQAVHDGRVVATVLSDAQGHYALQGLPPGSYRIRCHLPGGFLYWGAEQITDIPGGRLLDLPAGKTLVGIDFHFPPFKKGHWRSYSALDGLSHNAVADLYRDEKGYLWIATAGGVSRYDGSQFLNFTARDRLTHNSIQTIAASDGIWFGSAGGGVFHYNGETFEHLTQADGLVSNHVNALWADPDGTLWFGTAAGLSRYDGEHFLNFTTRDGLAFDEVMSIRRARDGFLWVGTGVGLSRYDGQGFLNFTSEDGLAGDQVNAILEDRDGTLWFGTVGGVSHYDGQRFQNLTPADGLIGEEVTAIHQDADGTLWFGTTSGVSRTDGRTFVNFTVADGLPSNWVNAILRDPEGVLWFATEEAGVARYDEAASANFAVQDGLLGNNVRCLYRDVDGSLWIGTDRGVSRYDGRQFETPAFLKALSADVWAIRRDPAGTLWIATFGEGVIRFDGERLTRLSEADGLAHRRVFSMDLAPDGTPWFGTDDGASHWIGGEFQNLTMADGLLNRAVRTVSCDADGTVWFGTLGWGGRGGLSRYDGTGFNHFTTAEGLAGDSVQAIYRDSEGGLWVGTWSGVSRYDGRTFTNLTTAQGLAHNTVLSIYRDSGGRTWFGTEGSGVSCFDGTAWSVLDVYDGLAGNSIPAIAEDGEGTLWFGTEGGITRYRRDPARPRVRLVSITGKRTYKDLRQLPTLTSGVRVTVSYHALDLKTIPEKRQYLIQIWQDEGNASAEPASVIPVVTSTTHAEQFDWTPPSPGSYLFQVQAIDRDLNYSRPARLRLRVEPPWYADIRIMLPVGSMLLVIVTGGLFSGWRYYAQRRQALQLREQMLIQERQNRQALEERNVELSEAREAAEQARMAAEMANRAKSIFLANMSHEIRTPLNAILGYAQILLRRSGLAGDVQGAISIIRDSGTHLLALINDILDLSKIEVGRTELHLVDFDLISLIDSLSVMFQLRCQEKGLRWVCELTGLRVRALGDAEPANTQTRQQEPTLVRGDEGKLRQVLINLLSNAVKFTEEGSVTLRVGIGAMGKGENETRGKREGEKTRKWESERGRERIVDCKLEIGNRPSNFQFSEVLIPVSFEVIDTGVGITPEELEEIFEPFEQGRHGAAKGGTGLGLTIARRQVELMGGELRCESKPGEGSRFYFTLELERIEISTSRERTAPSRIQLPPEREIRVLVVDDNRDNREVLAGLLEEVGISVLRASDGAEGMERIRTERPDLVFMDVRMPVMDGTEAMRAVFEQMGDDRPPVVAISASVLVHEQQQVLGSGFDGFLAKPFLAEDVIRSLAELLHLPYDDAPEPEPSPELSMQVSLPTELVAELREAAEFGRVTQLEALLTRVESQGEPGRLLAEQMRTFVRNFDMESLIDLLGVVEHDTRVESTRPDPDRG